MRSGLTAATLGGVSGSVLGQGRSASRPYLELIIYETQNGDPSKRLDTWAKEVFVPALKGAGVNAFGCFSLAVG